MYDEMNDKIIYIFECIVGTINNIFESLSKVGARLERLEIGMEEISHTLVRLSNAVEVLDERIDENVAIPVKENIGA